jgi:hypothetical protein
MAETVTASVQANSEIITATLTSGSEQMTAAINVAARGTTGPTGATGATGATGVGYSGISSASNITIGTGVKTFTLTGSNAGAFITGQRIRAIHSTTPTYWMEGYANYIGGGTLIITVDLVAGSGSHNAWNFAIAGQVGETGATGATGATGPQGPTGPTGPVSSVAGRTGAVTLAVADVSGAAPTASPTFTGTTTVSGTAAFTNAARPTSSASGSPDATSLMTRDDADTRYGTPYNLFLTSDISSSSTTYVDGSQTITLPAGTYEVDASLFGLTASATGGVELNVKLSANNDTAVSIQVMKTANISANGSQAATLTTLRNGSSFLYVCFSTHADAANKACAVLVKGTFTLSASTLLTPQVKQRTTTDPNSAARFLSGSYLRFIKR